MPMDGDSPWKGEYAGSTPVTLTNLLQGDEVSAKSHKLWLSGSIPDSATIYAGKYTVYRQPSKLYWDGFDSLYLLHFMSVGYTFPWVNSQQVKPDWAFITCETSHQTYLVHGGLGNIGKAVPLKKERF
jgi:hypothetical protein